MLVDLLPTPLLAFPAYSFPPSFAGWYRSLNAGSTVAETTCSG